LEIMKTELEMAEFLKKGVSRITREGECIIRDKSWWLEVPRN